MLAFCLAAGSLDFHGYEKPQKKKLLKGTFKILLLVAK